MDVAVTGTGQPRAGSAGVRMIPQPFRAFGDDAFDSAEQLVRSCAESQPVTPDGRYIVVRERLWRRANPALDDDRRAELVAELMSARRAVRAALRSGDAGELQSARRRVDEAKVALGERGPVWWEDGAPDQNRRMARNSTYAEWWAARTVG